jgi:hypothetical protein
MSCRGPASVSKVLPGGRAILTTWARMQTFRTLSAAACSDTSFSGGTTGIMGATVVGAVSRVMLRCYPAVSCFSGDKEAPRQVVQRAGRRVITGKLS